VGAHQILTEFDNRGEPSGIAFAVIVAGGLRQFSLPVNAYAVQAVLKRDQTVARYSSLEQAQRSAWRLLKDWLEAQLTFVETGMVTLEQAMLPYLRDREGRTVYELYLDGRVMGMPQLALEPDGDQDPQGEAEGHDDDQGQ
jgi:hypothetical protein